MMSCEYKSIKEAATAKIIEKKSRFIAMSGKVENETEALEFIDGIRRENREASHNTYAYIIGKPVPAARYSDDGEPHGTAGIPILEKIKHCGFTDTIIVVTRYFGGTLLGMGGLARAYSKSAAAVLENSGTAKYIPGRIISIESDYPHFGKIKNYLSNSGYKILNENYSGHVIIKALIPEKETGVFTEKIAELTNANAVVELENGKYIETEV